MNNQNMIALQRRVEKLMQLSSDQSENDVHQQVQRIVKRIKKGKRGTQYQGDQTMRKCIDIMQQNKQLKAELDKQYMRNDRINNQLAKLREENRELHSRIKSQQLNLRQNQQKQVKNKGDEYQRKDLKKIGKLQAQLQRAQQKCSNLVNLLQHEKKKCRQLSQFIREKLPKMQKTLTVLTTQVDMKMQQHYLKPYQ